ncbi:hypothetical protein AAFC00_003006 [Neodothiora populina]|uniref:F-box domain-containing protein n=1 Tax=Neodothiora populina TaxID=2781224 RepID=A0ABR3P8Y8_9PEZI
MQPQSPPIVQHTEFDTPPPAEDSAPTQHGLEDGSLPSSSSSSGFFRQDEGGLRSSDTSGVDELRPRKGAGAGSIPPPRPSYELSAPHTPATGSRNRITEYENASKASTPRRAETLGFEVIKKPRQPGDKRAPILELPNEVLTHTLAHLSPVDLSSISLVSRRFHELVTTPHAWRTAFSRFFPGPDSLGPHFEANSESDEEDGDLVRTERRAFTRLSSLASWRSEYIIRTRLLRSLARGKPVQVIASPAAARSGQSHVATPMTMYNLQMFTPVNHIHATFGNGSLNKRPLRFIHGADEIGYASLSDPSTGKVDSWGLGDPQAFMQFSDRYPGDAQYGLGPGEIVGLPNVMDVSQPHGMVYGEGSPHGLVYFRSTEELRGCFLSFSTGISYPSLGIPKITAVNEAICSVWIAKSPTIPSMTEGIMGILAGSSLGVLTAYSIGPLGSREPRYGRGEVTARWVLSPGVPIIALAIDEQYSPKRQAQDRVWAVALNALGEVFYLKKLPKHNADDKTSSRDDENGAHNVDEINERNAWLVGRSVYWEIAESSRRLSRPNPYEMQAIDGSYSPRSSWVGMGLGLEQIKAETREIEKYLAKKPKDFQSSCLGWDMRRRLEVDFANDDDNTAGETAVVFSCGLDEDSEASIRRYVRIKTHQASGLSPTNAARKADAGATTSIFGGVATPTFMSTSNDDKSARKSSDAKVEEIPDEWRVSALSFGGHKGVKITATSMDCSVYATLTTSEDPLLTLSSQSNTSSPSLTPLSQNTVPLSSGDVPGQRARLIAAGTQTGSVIVWNVRATIPQSSIVVNEVDPVRVIFTESPEISCLALTSLYLVHGGNDGLVQAWDPLASSMSPIRTLNSRFSSRARRRLIQAEASAQGVGINFFAAGAICLDPDAGVLRGMVSIGTQLRYWSYSSSAADQYKSSKRRLRRAERGSNIGAGVPNVPRGNYKDFIANERHELEMEAAQEAKQAARLAGRFGTELLGSDASEEEILAYARLLSEESLAQEAQRKLGDASDADAIESVIANSLQNTSISPEMAEAIRLSLEQEARDKANEWEDQQVDEEAEAGEGSNARELSDLEFALQLSLAEEQSKYEALTEGREETEEEYPVASQGTAAQWYTGKGKGRAM